MAYVRKKRVGDREYHQLVESYRENGRVRQRVLTHLGRYANVDAALEGLPRSIELGRRTLHKYPPKQQPGRARRLASLEEKLDGLRRLKEAGIA